MANKKTNTYLRYFFYGLLFLAFTAATITLGIFGLWIPFVLFTIATAAVALGIIEVEDYIDSNPTPSDILETKFNELYENCAHPDNWQTGMFFVPNTYNSAKIEAIFKEFSGLAFEADPKIIVTLFNEYFDILLYLKNYLEHPTTVLTLEDINRQWNFIEKLNHFILVGCMQQLDRCGNYTQNLFSDILVRLGYSKIFEEPFIKYLLPNDQFGFKLMPIAGCAQIMMQVILGKLNINHPDLREDIPETIALFQTFQKKTFESCFVENDSTQLPTTTDLTLMDSESKQKLSTEFENAKKIIGEKIALLQQLAVKKPESTSTSDATKPTTQITQPVISQSDSLQQPVIKYFKDHWALSFAPNKKNIQLTIHNAVIKDGAEKTCKNIATFLNETIGENTASYETTWGNSKYATVTIASNQLQKILDHAKNNAQPLPEIKESAVKLKMGERSLNDKNYLKIKHYFTTVWNLPDMIAFTETGDLFKHFHTKAAACRYMSLINEKLGKPITEVFKDQRFGFILHLKQQNFGKLLTHIDQVEQAEQNKGFFRKL